MKKLNFFTLMGLFSTVSFSMQKDYYQPDFLKGIENQFDANGIFNNLIIDFNGLNEVKTSLDFIQTRKYKEKEGIEAIIEEYNDIENSNDKKDHKKMLEKAKEAYICLYATFDHFNSTRTQKSQEEIRYFYITEEQLDDNHKNGVDIFNKENENKHHAIRISKLNNFFDEIHQINNTKPRWFDTKEIVNPHITGVPLFGSFEEKEFQAHLQKAIFDYSDIISELDSVDYANKVVFKLKIENKIFSKNINLDFLNKFKTNNNDIQNFHIHVKTWNKNDFYQEDVSVQYFNKKNKQINQNLERQEIFNLYHEHTFHNDYHIQDNLFEGTLQKWIKKYNDNTLYRNYKEKELEKLKNIFNKKI